MNEEQVRSFVEKILHPMSGVDGGCGYCGSEVLIWFTESWPEWKKLVCEIWAKQYDSDLFDSRR